MSRRIMAGYLIFCILFFVGLSSYAAFRLIGKWNSNREAAELELGVLARESSPYYLTTLDFSDPAFLKAVRTDIEGKTRLLSATIYSRQGGVQYIYAKRREVAPLRPTGAGSTWAGRPHYGDFPWGTVVVTIPYVTGTADDIRIDGVFAILSRRDIFPVLKEVFILLLCFFMATLVVLVVAPLVKATGSRPRAEVRETRPPQRSTTLPAQPNLSAGRSPELFNQETGLGWEHHVEQRLKYELKRAASFDQDMVLAFIELAGTQRQRRAYVRAASIVLRTFPFHDLAFEYGPTRYAVIVPDHDLDQGIEVIELLKRNLPRALTICAGLSSRNGRLVSEQRLMVEAEGALKRAMASGAGWVEAFKADPEKYREMVAEKNDNTASSREIE